MPNGRTAWNCSSAARSCSPFTRRLGSRAGRYIYPHDTLLERFAEADADFVLYGHTHHQVVQRFGGVLVINPGSAGDARDTGNGRQLSCAVLDTGSDEVVVTDFPDRPSPIREI